MANMLYTIYNLQIQSATFGYQPIIAVCTSTYMYVTTEKKTLG